jgi:hypothetical protein
MRLRISRDGAALTETSSFPYLSEHQSNKLLSNLFVTMLHRLGVKTDRFISNTGNLSELESCPS